MADNYLEKKFEQLRSGRPIYRKVNPSLDTLLAQASSETGKAETGNVKGAQLEAIARSASKSSPGAVACMWDEQSSTLTIECSGLFDLGAAALAARLKACELHLKAERVEISEEYGNKPARTVLKIGR